MEATLPQAVGLVIALVSAVGIVVIGGWYLVAPRSIATGFGLPVVPGPEASGWLRLKGVRDVVSGAVVVPLLLLGDLTVLGGVLVVLTLVPLGDLLVILREGGSRTRAVAVHGATALVMAGGAGLLLA